MRLLQNLAISVLQSPQNLYCRCTGDRSNAAEFCEACTCQTASGSLFLSLLRNETLAAGDLCTTQLKQHSLLHRLITSLGSLWQAQVVKMAGPGRAAASSGK